MLQKQEIQVVVLGPSSSGKSQLINRLTTKPFDEKADTTIGIKLTKQTITAERTIFYRDIGDSNQSLTQKYITKAHQLYLVFNAHDPDGLTKLQQYLHEHKFIFPKTAHTTLIGTHQDLGLAEGIETKAQQYVQPLQGDYYLISLKQNHEADYKSLVDKTKQLQIELEPKVFSGRNSLAGSVYEDDESTQGETKLTTLALQNHNKKTEEQFIQAADLIQRKRSFTRQEKTAIELFSSPPRHNRLADEGNGETLCPELNPYKAQKKQNKNSKKTSTLLDRIPPQVSQASSGFSFALRMAGMAIMLAALTNLIYLTIIFAGFLSSVAMIAAVNQVIITVGGLLGMSAPMATFSSLCAALGMSTTLGSAVMATTTSLLGLGLGYRLFRCGKPAAESTDPNPPATPIRPY